MDNHTDNQDSPVLTAEACPVELFEKLHCFSSYEEGVILSLLAHEPVLVRGSRGSGKTVLLREASRRLLSGNSHIFGVHLNLKSLMRTNTADYERMFCELLTETIRREFEKKNIYADFSPAPNAVSVCKALTKFGTRFRKRVILFLDDAVHIERKMPSAVFFDIFRTLSSGKVSCKAATCLGFGNDDLFNIASEIYISRDGRGRFFVPFFTDVTEAGYPGLSDRVSRTINKEDAANFLGRAVLGNMRAFVFLCGKIQSERKIGLKELGNSLIYMSECYYQPLLEKLRPDLGIYEPMTETAGDLAEGLFSVAEQSETASVVIHRSLIRKFVKPLEILEYAGLISLGEMTRRMKSGEEGSRFRLNLCSLLKIAKGRRLSGQKFNLWSDDTNPPAEIDMRSDMADIKLPDLSGEKQILSIADLPIEQLTEKNIAVWKSYGINTIGELIERISQIKEMPAAQLSDS